MNTTYVQLFAPVMALLAPAPFLRIARFLFEIRHPMFASRSAPDFRIRSVFIVL
jgi:hypothetical protein